MLPETSTADLDRDPGLTPAAPAIEDDDEFPFRFGFPPRPGPPPPSALASALGPDRRQSSAPAPLLKHNSWSPDSLREETWQRRKDLHRQRRKDRMCRSVTEEDLEELRGCIDLGFGFDEGEEEEELGGGGPEEVGDRGDAGTPKSAGSSSSGQNKKLWELLPALDLYYAVRRQSRRLPPPSPTPPAQPAAAASSSSSAGSSPLSLYSPGDSPREVKARLKQWAQVVACSVRQQGY